MPKKPDEATEQQTPRRVMRSALQLANNLDKLLAPATPFDRQWALSFISDIYCGTKDPSKDAVEEASE